MPNNRTTVAPAVVVGPHVARLHSPRAQRLGVFVLRRLGWQLSGDLPDLAKMVVAVAPHTSNCDFVIALAASFALDIKISFLGKHSIFVWPLRRFLLRFGGIPVERRNSHGVVTQLAATFARESQLILGLAPEGTRQKVQQWKSGFWHIAREAQVPVLLVGLDYGTKTVVFGPLLMPGDDFAADLAHMQAFFRQMQPRHPANFA